MNKINEIINLLDEVSKDPKLTVKKYKRKNRKRRCRCHAFICT